MKDYGMRSEEAGTGTSRENVSDAITNPGAPSNTRVSEREHHQIRQGCGRHGELNLGYPQITTAVRRKFKGRDNVLKDQNGVIHIYDLANPRETENQFRRMIEDISGFVGDNYNKGGYIKRPIKNMASVGNIPGGYVRG